jgi:serine/threonine kinase 16
MSFNSLNDMDTDMEDVAIEYHTDEDPKGITGTEDAFLFNVFRRKQGSDEKNDVKHRFEVEEVDDKGSLFNGLRAKHQEWKTKRESVNITEDESTAATGITTAQEEEMHHEESPVEKAIRDDTVNNNKSTEVADLTENDVTQEDANGDNGDKIDSNGDCSNEGEMNPSEPQSDDQKTETIGSSIMETDVEKKMEDGKVQQTSTNSTKDIEKVKSTTYKKDQPSVATAGDNAKGVTTDTNIIGIFSKLFQPSIEKNPDAADLQAAARVLEERSNSTTPKSEAASDEYGSPGILNMLRRLTTSNDDEGIDEGKSKDVENDYGEVENAKSSDSVGIFERLRTKLQETPDKRAEADKESLDDGNAVMNLIHRTREEWNKRGTITFPERGTYLERTVRIGQKFAEGGFSIIFHATDLEDTVQKYALKRIQVEDDETWEACEKESIICNVLKEFPTYILPILGLKIDDQQRTCYMLLPYMPNSLRAEIDKRFFLKGKDEDIIDEAAAPWDETLILKMFYHLLHGVEAMHEIGYSHRDLKVDNILFHGFGEDSLTRPLLSDFGSAGPLLRYVLGLLLHSQFDFFRFFYLFQFAHLVCINCRPCGSRREIFEIAEDASQFTTLAYRPPELFPGALMVGHHPLDYSLVDAWSLGCTLFAILFGASPFESQFSRTTGKIRIGDCNQLSVLSDIPRPEKTTPPSLWYSKDVWNLLEFMLEKDRAKRPSLSMIQIRVSSLLTKETIPKDVNKVDTVAGFL